MSANVAVILHIATTAAWDEAQRSGAYTADSLATEGFIHCSDPGQVAAVANRLFRGRTDLVLLQIDISKLVAPVRYENLEGGTDLFPHVYGALPLAAVTSAVAFEPNADGTFDGSPLRDLPSPVGRSAATLPRPRAADMTPDESTLLEIAHAIATAIGRREVPLLAGMLAPGFVYRGDAGQTAADASAFLDGIAGIPGEIAFVRLERVAVDVTGDAALVSGVQHARLTVDGQTIDDRRGFADLFIRIDGAWKLRAGSDFPLA